MKGRMTMNDIDIVSLYWARDERAISETDTKYGRLCRSVALNILSVNEDAEECVNDTYHKVWNVIPPQRPEKFRAWLLRIVRNISLNMWNKNHAAKRYSGMETLLSELDECVPAKESVDDSIDGKELGRVISGWLRTLSADDRTYFVMRYWNGVPLKDIAKRFGITPDRLAQKMHRLRAGLKEALEKEDISL